MEKTFKVVNYGIADSVGDTFMPGSIFINRNRKLFVLKDFNHHSIIGCVIAINHNDTGIEVTADFTSDPTGLYPAIGFQTVGVEKRMGGLRDITDAELYWIGLTVEPNADATIKPID